MVGFEQAFKPASAAPPVSKRSCAHTSAPWLPASHSRARSDRAGGRTLCSAGKNADVLEAQSRALFDNVNAAEAAEILRQVINLASDPAHQTELKETLNIYQAVR